MHVDRAACFADLQHQRVGGNEGVRAGVQRPSPKRLHLGVEIFGHLGHLRLRQPGNAQSLDQLLHPEGADAEQIGGCDHADQRGLAPAGAAPAATPGSSCPAVASAPPARCCPPGCPSPATGSRYECSSGQGCAARSRRRRPRPHRPTSTPRRRSEPSAAAGPGWPETTAQPSTPEARYWGLRSSSCSLSEICERTSNKITRWPLHITTPRSSTTNSHTTCLGVTYGRRPFLLKTSPTPRFPDRLLSHRSVGSALSTPPLNP